MIARLSGILDGSQEDEAEERPAGIERGERDNQRDTNPKRGTVSGQSSGRESLRKVR